MGELVLEGAISVVTTEGGFVKDIVEDPTEELRNVAILGSEK